jgi:hypothetical protein
MEFNVIRINPGKYKIRVGEDTIYINRSNHSYYTSWDIETDSPELIKKLGGFYNSFPTKKQCIDHIKKSI